MTLTHTIRSKSMRSRCFLLPILFFGCLCIQAQDVYELDTFYPVHTFDQALQVIPDRDLNFSPEQLLKDTTLNYLAGNKLPKYLEVGTVYWGKLHLITKDSLKGWTLHFEDRMIGPPAWTKSNGKVDVYAYADGRLIFHKKTGVEYQKNDRDIGENWVLNRIKIDQLPLNKSISLIMKVQGNSIGYPAYFNLSARSPKQPYYHQIFQFNNSFNIFMFGVTFIIFLYHVLQFIYLRQSIFFWFSLWLLFCTLTHAMSIGLIIGDITRYRFPVWMLFANGVFFTFWFFGRSFVDSKIKFPILDRFMQGLALFLLLEIVITILYVILFDPQTYFTGVGIHYLLLNIYTILSLVLSVVLVMKKDSFAKYFGIGSIIASIALMIGTLWSSGIIKMPLRLDPYATGIFLQIIIYSFGIAYRQQRLSVQAQEEQLEATKSNAEVRRITDLNEIKTRFLTNISHEFRTPLTLIEGPLLQAQRLNQSNGDDDAIALSQKDFKIIERNSKRLKSLVDELLELSKLESGKVVISLSNETIMPFIKSIVFSFESMAERSGIILRTRFEEGGEQAYFDKDKLEKIIYNIMSNAFKYTPVGGIVTVETNLVPNFINLRISDTGKGIKEADTEHIFDRFYRVEGTEEKGSGIGLALSKELVELQKGKINVVSTVNVGTTFEIKLPISLQELPDNVIVKEKKTDPIRMDRLDTDEPLILYGNSPNTKELPIALVVEDNADLRSFMTDVLSDQYHVLHAINGLQGERIALEEIPDIIVSDVMMPEMNGFELCNSLKNNVKTSHIPLVILTAKAGHMNKMEGFYQGADAYLTKPFAADELLVRMKNLIALRKRIWEKVKNTNNLLVDDLELTSLDDGFLQKVFKILEEKLDDETLSVGVLAKAVGFSRTQLHRKLKGLLNKSPNQLIAEIRLNKAFALLKSKAGTVSEVAYSVGYSNLSYFTKSFKEKFKALPSSIFKSGE